MIRKLAAWVALVSLVVVPPALLVAVGFRDWAALSVNAPTDVRLLLAVLTVVGWIAWAGWVVALAVEAGSLWSGRSPRHLPGLRWGQLLAGTLLAAAVSSSGNASVMAAPASPAPPTMPVVGAESTTLWTATPQPEVPGTTTPLDATTPPTADGEEPAGTDSPTARGAVWMHVVESGDDLWSLAERYYGDGTSWRTIVAANPDLQADPMADLSVGTQLSIDQPVRLVTVVRGDTLSGLAEQYLGDGDRWPEIHQLNQDRVTDPDMIDIGWVLRVPMLALASSPTAAEQHVESGATADVDTTTVDAPDSDTGDGGTSGGAGGAAAPEASPAPVTPPAPDIDGAAHRGTDTTTASATTLDHRAITGVVGGLTTLTASVVLGGVAARRRLQAQARPVGRRFQPPDGETARVESALGLVGGAREPDREDLLERAMRHISLYWRDSGHPGAVLAEAVVRDIELEFTFRSDPGAPETFQHVGNRLAIAWSRLRELPDVAAPVAFPALVTLGADSDGGLVMVDLVSSGVTGVRGGGAELTTETLSAMLVELACAPWAAELRLLVVTRDEAFAHVAGTHRIRTAARAQDAIDELERLVDVRRRELAEETWQVVRLDPDLADAWVPHIVVFESVPTPAQRAYVEELVEASRCGVAAVLPVDQHAGDADWEVTATAGRAEVRTPAGRELAAQTVPTPTREAIGRLYTLADAEASERAPWWAEDPEESVNIIELRPGATASAGPRVLLLGPIDLEGAAGEVPARAARQCIEYCAWLLEHPGGTPSAMVGQLFVSDATRRSNLSRLRAWLGSDDQGEPYLPDAYSGRIRLHDGVTSDWQELQALTAGGINRMPLERLKAALELVRGAPLADASPGQWGWAEELRSDMAALIRDLGVVTSRMARERGDLLISRWAANRALGAAPDDELLLCERIRTERAGGRPDEVERLVGRLHRQARTLGVDLLPETVELVQEVVEGRVRTRQA